jgi:release factor glutamine methyltransferase
VVARRNAVALGLDIEFVHGQWLAPMAQQRVDLIVSNPPYVAAGDPHLADLAFEPQSALVSGPEGLTAIREIARAAPSHLNPGGWLLVEHGRGQDAPVRQLLETGGLEEVASWPDLAGIPRVSGGKVK